MSRRLKIGCPIFIVILAAGILIPLKFLRSKPVQVDVEKVKVADIDETVAAVPVAGQPAGMVKPDEVKVIPKIGGELVALLVEEGHRVVRGQVIAYLDSRSVDLQLAQARETADAARARVAQARADLEAQPVRTETAITEARAALDRAVASYDTALRGAREEEVERARLLVVQAEKDLEDARASLATIERGARPEEIAAAEAGLKQAESQAQSSQASLDLMLEGPRPEDVAQAKATLRDAEAQVKLRKAELDSHRALAEGGHISPNALRAAETTHESAVAARDSARERLALAEKPYRPEEIEQARASLASAQAAVERARQDLKLLKTRTTPQDLASARARRDAAQARLDAAQADLRLTENRTTPEELQQAEATVRQARAGLARAEAERVQIREQELSVAQLEADLRRSQAALEQAADAAGYTIIRAPIDGTVTRTNVEEGEYVQGGGIALPSAEIAMLVVTSDSVWIECNVDEADVTRIEVGQPCDIFLTDTDILEGHVHHVSPSVRLVQGDVRTFAIEIAVDGDTSNLRSGMSVDVDIIVKSTKDAVSVSSFAIFDDKEGNRFVYKLVDGKADKTEVEIGAEGIERTEILAGVAEGDEIITSLEARGLSDGKKVKVRKDKDDDDGDEDDEQEAEDGEEEESEPPGEVGITID